MKQGRVGIFAGSLLLLIGALWGAEKMGQDTTPRPHPPSHVRGQRQDFQAARITWDRMQNSMKYFLYASYDKPPLAFHKENDEKPINDTFAIWDAPREGSRKFIFYVTAVDPQGHESEPSKQVHVDLGPLPTGLPR